MLKDPVARGNQAAASEYKGAALGNSMLLFSILPVLWEEFLLPPERTQYWTPPS